MEIVLATGNKDKVREIKEALRGLPLKLFTADDFKDFPKVREDRPTIAGNAAKKAESIARYTGKASLADDTGLMVRALKGAPGVYSSRYAGYGASYDDNCRKLLRSLKNTPLSKRKASFKTVIALAIPGRKTLFAEGSVKGFITTEKTGKMGFGYDPVFMPLGSKKTFAEMSLDKKNSLSHRGRALKKARVLLKALLKNA